MKKPVFGWIKDAKSALPPGRWFVEFFTPGEFHAHRIKKVLASSDTAFQKTALASTAAFGEVLVIDGETQSSAMDEYFYHETLVCPSLLAHKHPRTALILGGGEGATAREILNSRTIESVVMADIDYNIIGFAKRHLGVWHRGAFEDPRLTLVTQDAAKLVENTSLKFDLIYADLPSPIECGPAFGLYTLEFYRKLKGLLAPGGIFTTHAGPGTPLQFELHCALARTLKLVFSTVRSYATYIPSYDMPWSFLYCADSRPDPALMAPSAFDRAAASRLKRKPRYHDGNSITGSFRLPKYYNDRMSAGGPPVTMARPMFFTTSQRS